MGTLQGSWIWYELITGDPAAAKAFYEPILGWKMILPETGSGGYGFVTAPDGAMVGGLLELTTDMKRGGARPGWLGYIGVDDIVAALHEVEATGGKVQMPARDVPGAGRIAMVADPGGAPFYLMHPVPPPGSEGAESTAFQAEPNRGHCGWNELLAADAHREVRFYTELLDWSLPEPMDMGAMGQYQFIAHDGVTTGAIMPVMPEMPAPLWNHYFWVQSITQAQDLITAQGGKIINGPMQVPGDDWIIQGIDPQGAMFSLVGGA